jgi:hypothetical protein
LEVMAIWKFPLAAHCNSVQLSAVLTSHYRRRKLCSCSPPDLHDLGSVCVPCGISNCEVCNSVGSAQTDLGYIVDSRRTMLLYAFVSKEKISNATPHGRHARMTWHSFAAPSQLFTIESVPKANQRRCISVSWKINTIVSRTHYSAKKKVINV